VVAITRKNGIMPAVTVRSAGMLTLPIASTSKIMAAGVLRVAISVAIFIVVTVTV
jgi:hypothetical protein